MQAALQVQHLRKSFGGLTVAADVSLEVHGGQIHALIGPNGAGKTTLIAQIAGEVCPDGGRILLQGRDITQLPVHGRARLGLARSFQISALMDELTVAENLLLAATGAGQRQGWWRPAHAPLPPECRTLLEEAGLMKRAKEPVAALSHGERRQLELAMALVAKPSVLLLDEPMAGLSASESQAMTERLAALKGKDVAIVLVEHDMEAVFALADVISVLVHGEIIAHGTPQEIRANEEVRRAYLG